MSYPGLFPVSSPAPVSNGPVASCDSSFYLLGESAAIRRVRSQMERLAPHLRVALITGEPGTGKQTVARLLHQRSPLAHQGQFISCAASTFVEDLAPDDSPESSQLFQSAHRGTLFLEDLDTLAPLQQVRLLRMLRHHESAGPQRTTLRILAASSRDLRLMTSTGQFHDDLYRRTAAVEIALPTLRERPEDIVTTAEAILHRISGSTAMSYEVLSLLKHAPWPHNIRQLHDALSQAAIAANGSVLELRHLPTFEEEPAPAIAAIPAPQSDRLQEIIQQHVLTILTRCDGNKLRAAEVLGISRSTLYRMLDACSVAGTAEYTG